MNHWSDGIRELACVLLVIVLLFVLGIGIGVPCAHWLYIHVCNLLGVPL